MTQEITDCGAKALLWEIFNSSFSELISKWKYLINVRHYQQNSGITISSDSKDDLRSCLIKYIHLHTHRQIFEHWGQLYIDNINEYRDIRKMRVGYDIVCHYIMYTIGEEKKPSEHDCLLAEEIIERTKNKRFGNPFQFIKQENKHHKNVETLDIAIPEDYNSYINGNVNNLNNEYGF